MDKKYKCKHCDQVFGLVQNRNRHEKVGIVLLTFIIIKITSVKIYLNNHYFHVLTFQTHYV